MAAHDVPATKSPLPHRSPAPVRSPAPPAPARAKRTGEYEVGYGKPPKSSQFKPGPDPRRPKGRKAESKNHANVIIAMLESPTSVRTPDGGIKTITTVEAMALKLRELALKGDWAALSKALELYHKSVPPSPPPDTAGTAPLPDSGAELSQTDEAILDLYAAQIIAGGKSSLPAREATEEEAKS